jgi:hypothetical protein
MRSQSLEGVSRESGSPQAWSPLLDKHMCTHRSTHTHSLLAGQVALLLEKEAPAGGVAWWQNLPSMHETLDSIPNIPPPKKKKIERDLGELLH